MNDEESLDDSGLANFEPLAPGTLTKQPVDKKEEKIDAAIGVEAFSKLDVNQLKMIITKTITINIYHITHNQLIMQIFTVLKMNL